MKHVHLGDKFTEAVRMVGVRYWHAIAAGVVGWVGGIYFGRNVFKKLEVSAANIILPSSAEVVPVEPPETSSRASQIMRFGFPSLDTIKSKSDYVLSYDRRNRVANWVFEHLNKDSLKYDPNIGRSKSEFFEDESIHPFFRSSNDDYRRSGYDRGHLAAAGNHRSKQELIDDTFALSNIAPQVGKGFNRDSWNTLEKHVRHLTKYYKNVYVCTGPLYLPRDEPDGKRYVKFEVVGQNNVAVPTHFFKVVVCETDEREFDLEAYVMQNAPIDDKVPLNAFMVPKESIERAAGLLLFDRIPLSRFRFINGMKYSLQ